jgi:Biotin/lipoate A/B protein ligase family
MVFSQLQIRRRDGDALILLITLNAVQQAAIASSHGSAVTGRAENCKTERRSRDRPAQDSIHPRPAKQSRSWRPLRPGDMEQTLDLPPGYTLVALRELGDAFRHGCQIAAEAGAGTLVWVRRYDLVEFAVVLEPCEPLKSARRAFFAGMNALADAIAAHCPPEREISFDWPDSIRFDMGLLGGGRLGWPADCGEDDVPAWLVFGAMLRAADMMHVDAVEAASGVSLLSEGFEMVDTDAIIESFTRHLMTAFDRWNERGFEAIARDYLERLPRRKAGERRGIDINGDLLARLAAGSGAPERSSLVDALARASWYDSLARSPKFG